MNKYSNISLSEFNPMGLQEKMLVPAIKRKQHDAISADQTAILDKLNKVSPHDKFFNEAQLLKKQITDKISDHAAKLSKEGISNSMLSDTIALNREYNDLSSDTGKLGMINKHNLNVSAVEADYMKQAKEANQSPEAAKYWIRDAMAKHMKSPMYDDRGRVIDFKVDQDVAKFVDREAKFHEFAKSVDGLSGTSWDDVRSDFDTRGDGTLFVNERGSKGHTKNNYVALQKVADYMNAQLRDTTSDLYKSEMYNRRNIDDSMKANQSQSALYRKYDNDSGTTSKISNVKYPEVNTNQELEGPQGVPLNDEKSTTVIGGNKTNTSEIERIGSPSKQTKITFDRDGNAHEVEVPWNGTSVKKVYSSADIKDPIQRNLYDKLFDKLKTKEGYVHTNTNGSKTTYTLKAGMSKDDPRTSLMISKLISGMPEMTYERKLITKGGHKSNFGFIPGEDPKEDSPEENAITKALKAGLRDFIVDGKLVKWNDVISKFGKPSSVQYNGYKSALSLSKHESPNTTTTMMPHSITLTNNDGKTETFEVSRIVGQDDIAINKDRVRELNENYAEAVASSRMGNVNEILTFKSKSPNLSGKNALRYRYSPPVSNDSQGSFIVYDANNKAHTFTEDEFVAQINKIN